MMHYKRPRELQHTTTRIITTIAVIRCLFQQIVPFNFPFNRIIITTTIITTIIITVHRIVPNPRLRLGISGDHREVVARLRRMFHQ